VHSFNVTGSKLYVSIVGVKGVKVDDINKTLITLDELAHGAIYQLFDADYIAGPNHIYHATANAHHALNNGYNISSTLSIETLLYAACNNQINKAIKILGVSRWTYNVAVTVFSETKNDPLALKIAKSLGEIDDTVLGLTREKYGQLKDLFDITEESIGAVGKEPYDALTGLITEKGALIGLRR
jgi:KEOPS complex subunit Cgi121